jgi:Protein of unknown function C-terminus (DUF2399)
MGVLEKLVATTTKQWKEEKRRADRSQRVSERALERMRKASRADGLTVKDATYYVMADAYEKASGTLGLANARQIMYAARPLVLELTGGDCWSNSSYFTQRLLPDFMNDPGNAELTRGWDIVFDARGHFAEPHTRARTELGTVDVRGYIDHWTKGIEEELDINLDHRCPTRGPANRYRFALFIEKEGFDPHLSRARIADRFDLAIMSTKGMSVTASRSLIEALSDAGVTILVLHDFDKSGLSILHTMRTNTRRYTFRRAPRVIDLGLRLEDAERMGLESEPVTYDSAVDPRVKLRECGATEAECNFLVTGGQPYAWVGERIELNAMDSIQFIQFVESKLTEMGADQKVIPNQVELEAAWRRGWRRAIAQEAIDNVSVQEIVVPHDIGERVRAGLTGSDKAWDDVLWDLVQEQREEGVSEGF